MKLALDAQNIVEVLLGLDVLTEVAGHDSRRLCVVRVSDGSQYWLLLLDV